MTKPNFAAMTKQELRTYVLEHRDDNEAFYALTRKLREEPGIQITSMEQLQELIAARHDKIDIQDAHAALEESSVNTMFLEDLKRELG